MNTKSTLARSASKFGIFPAGRDIAALSLAFITVAFFFDGVLATIYFRRLMGEGMDMPGGWTMSMMWMRMPGQTWAESGLRFLLMWLGMMAAMMLPSAVPMLSKLRRSSVGTEKHRFEGYTLFAAAGYFFVWLLIGAVVYMLGVAFSIATMRMHWLSCLAPALSGTVLIIAGIIQLSPWKMSALRKCRAPDCDATFMCGTLKGSWSYGLKQGAACGICCAAPMLALLVLGMMNLTLMAITTAVITMEKLLPRPEETVRLFGSAAILLGLGFLLQHVC